MVNMKELFGSIKKSFTIKRVVDFEKFDLHFSLEPLTSMEELKVLEVCTGHEGGAFVSELKRSSLAYSIKKINEVEFTDDLVVYPDENGFSVKESKYIFLTKHIDNFPVALRDVLFEAFNDLQLEMESLVDKNAKFERFNIKPAETEAPVAEEAGMPKGFRRVDETAEPEPETEVERLNKQVEKERDQAQAALSGI
jgi:hypothetical protein